MALRLWKKSDAGAGTRTAGNH